MNPFDHIRAALELIPDDPSTGTGWRDRRLEQPQETPEHGCIIPRNWDSFRKPL